MKGAYYNEHDKHAAAWLRELIKNGLIAPGDVDERDIQDVRPDDVDGYTQCHFFAGIGGWSYALRLAGWPDDRSVWTGSCPCQPFSVGATDRAQGQSDARHCWPAWLRLIRECRPTGLLGEQVKNAIKWGWLDEVACDLEAEDYAFGAAVLRANAFGADHERQRVYWMADSRSKRRERYQSVDGVSVTTTTALAVDGDTLVRARRALDGDISGLLHCDGLSVVMERHALKGYGNAIVPQVAAEFIRAYMDVASLAAQGKEVEP